MTFLIWLQIKNNRPPTGQTEGGGTTRLVRGLDKHQPWSKITLSPCKQKCVTSQLPAKTNLLLPRVTSSPQNHILCAILILNSPKSLPSVTVAAILIVTLCSKYICSSNTSRPGELVSAPAPLECPGFKLFCFFKFKLMQLNALQRTYRLSAALLTASST